MSTSTVTTKGQITIPAEVRKALGLHTGSRVVFVATETGTYELVAETRTVRTLKGIVGHQGKPVSLDEMDRAISEGAAEGADA